VRGAGLKYDTPHLLSMVAELCRVAASLQAEVLVTHGYKSDLVGLLASRRMGIPLVAVSHGWTRESWKVRVYERIGKWALARADRVVCVSKEQADRAIQAGVPRGRVSVIRNAVDVSRFDRPDAAYRERLLGLPSRHCKQVVVAAGRLSPEKGFDVLVGSAAEVARHRDDVGFVLFGEGPCRTALTKLISKRGLADCFVLAGFESDLDRWIPHADAVALSSWTEGLPNIVLEAMAAGVPVAATAVGGIGELLENGRTGRLTAPGDEKGLSHAILDLLEAGESRRRMVSAARERVESEFSFQRKAAEYVRLIDDLIRPPGRYQSAHSLLKELELPCSVQEQAGG
jgi:glycosyltransferase involved in cell wall biosynthesis